MKEHSKVSKMVIIAMLSGVAAVIMIFDFPVLPAAPFLRVDFSDIPAIIGGIIFGPITGAVIVLLKNIINVITTGTTTLGIGSLANFVSGAMFVIPIVMIYRKNQTTKNLIKGLLVGATVTTIGSAIFNYFVLLPLYIHFLNFPVDNLLNFVITLIIPFNIIKSTIVSVAFVLVYQNMKVWLKQRITSKKGLSVK